MSRSVFLAIRRRLRAALLTPIVWLPLLVLGMPLWIHAHGTQGAHSQTTHTILPDPSAGYKVVNLAWMDAARSRRVPARLFWPVAAQSESVPLVIFSPGIGSSRDGYTYLGRYWAEHGIASLHLQHVGSDRSLWLGNPFSLISRFQSAASDAEAIARVKDARFALDRLLASRLGPHIALDQIAAAGHSYGANTTLLEAGATVTRNGEVLNFRDPRISAAILISAPPFYGEPDFRPILASITIPTLHITTEDDVIRIPGFNSGVSDREKIFDATGSGHKVLAIYNEGSHNVFTDRRYFDSKQVAEKVKADTRALSLTFLEQAGSGFPQLDSWPARHPGLIGKYVVVTRE
ncbi:alpha/beta hydrolase family protein [Dokdonella sp.]|uniref:alpha/beta hydrolase family protein n=1 Tax=Dokdonella sp. TaxID=2291710 RepID=UPI003527DCE5